ncbi:eukaryotic translation initiation factor 3 subunit B-like [Gigantopelta aegis]|uniref:eukaryotic translation initiation factor 3 subunit B-like n=1 Tax=Gigantopelta aegis TaxID=1735272 RepID=UPI001B88A4E1|nr:eukaryotic translation initiation factor 3 subunit B-like [Gigantopelta aegis]
MAAGREIMEGKRTDSNDENDIDSDEEEEPDFNDPEDFVDDITDEELLADLWRSKPKSTDGIDSVVVVDNVPSVGPDRLEKLQNVLHKLFSKFGKIVNEHYPMEDGKTKGYIFLEYSSPLHAQEAVKMTNGYKLDKQHTFCVNLFSDFEKYENIPAKWETPQPKPYVDPGNLRYFLLDKECRDQFSVIYDAGEKTAIFLNSVEPILLEERARWTETYVRWSPQGTYLATFHQKGIALWGGEKFSQIMKFSHPGVQLLDFSPCEKYMVSFSPLQDNLEDPQAIIIWDIRTGEKKRGFHCETQGTWPIFKWNFDGSYFARIGQDAISVYETPSFGLLDKKSIKVIDVRDFSWSPTDNVMANWVPEMENVPARVSLIEIPSRKELCAKNLFNVASCKMQWQKNGDYLCVKVDRYSKAKRMEDKDQMKYSGTYFNFEIFRLREKQIPVDKIEVKEIVYAFAWEPTGHKFAFIHGESPRISVSFYAIRPGGKVDLLKVLEKRTANHLFWSPNGQFIVLAGLRSMNGILEFVDTQDMTVMTQTEHFMATDVEWDPTGRYVASAVSWWGHKVDNAYWIWNFQGNLLYKKPMERFCQLLWRPRPASLLKDKQIKEIRKNFKKFAQQFEIEDISKKQSASKELLEKRRQLMDEYKQFCRDRTEEFEQLRDRRIELRDGVETDELDSHEDNMEEEVIEFLVEVQEIIVEE